MSTRVIITWLCNLFDAAVTAWFRVALGPGWEINPISAWLLGQSVGLFVTVKIVLMSIGLLGCWIGRKRLLCRALVWVAFVEYMLVAGYYIHELVWAWIYTV